MFSFEWAAIGILGYFLWQSWRAAKKSDLKLMARVSFNGEWLLLKSLIAVDYKAFNSQLDGDGLPDEFRYPWIRMHYNLNDPEEFMRDIRDNNSLYPVSVNYEELIEESKRLTRELLR